MDTGVQCKMDTKSVMMKEHRGGKSTVRMSEQQHKSSTPQYTDHPAGTASR